MTTFNKIRYYIALILLWMITSIWAIITLPLAIIVFVVILPFTDIKEATECAVYVPTLVYKISIDEELGVLTDYQEYLVEKSQK